MQIQAPTRDRFGSRCRDLLTGHWIGGGECPPPADAAESGGRETFAFGPNGITRYELTHALVAIDSMVVSNDPFTFAPNPDYPQEFQPRSRDRAATRLQVLRIAGSLDPDQMLLDFHAIDRGSPIVMRDGERNIVLSGNGRTMGLMIAEAAAKPDLHVSWVRYQAALEDVAPTLGGLRPVGGQSPVLVRLVDPSVDPVAFAREANAPVALSPSSIEQARTDADRITLDMIVELDVGDEPIEDSLRAARNRPFVARFLAGMTPNEQAALVDADGRLNQTGLQRAMVAVFVRALPGRAGLTLAERAFESIDQDVKVVINGVGRALGQLAKAESLTAAGKRDAQLAIGEDLATAVNVFAKIRRTAGLNVVDYLSQQQLFARELTAFQEVLLSFLDDNTRSARRIGDRLRAYADLVIAQPPPEQSTFFDTAGPTREELWASAADSVDAGQHFVAAARNPRDLVDWCNTNPEQQDVVWDWRALRDVLMIGAAQQPVVISVCSAGLTGQEFQVTFDFSATLHPTVAFSMVRKAARALGTNAQEVPEFGTKRLVYEIVIPERADKLVFQPAVISTFPARRAPETQPTLFQSWGGNMQKVKAAQVNVAQLGSQQWVRWHADAEKFRQDVDGNCGCGDHAVHAMQGWHDAVNLHLGKPVQHPEDLRGFASFMNESVAMLGAGFAAAQACPTTLHIRADTPAKREAVFAAEDSLRQAGVTFDTGFSVRPQERDWELDWSLQGATLGQVDELPALLAQDDPTDRNVAIARIRSALQRRSGKSWSVTGGRGTAWGWITITAPPARRPDFGRMTDADRNELGRLLGLGGAVHPQGESIPAGFDYRIEYVDRAEGREPSKFGKPYWDNASPTGFAQHYEQAPRPFCSPSRAKVLEDCIQGVKARGDKVNPYAVCIASVGCKPRRSVALKQAELSAGYMELLLGGAASALGATLAATAMARALGGSGATATSPEAALTIIDKKAEERKQDAPGVFNPPFVEGDQAQVDLGTMLEEIDAILRNPSRMGLIDPETRRVLSQGVPA